jgi:autotransporter translocation and assembly factor TamB
MRSVKIFLGSLVLLLGLAGAGTCAILPDITNWGGAYLLSLIQSKVNGQVSAREISGNPITGITYKDLEISGPDGKPVLAAARLEIRLSLWSIPTFHLDLGSLALVKPRVFLAQAKSGQWNVSRLVKPGAPPAKSPGITDKIIAYFLRRVDLPRLLVQKGEIFLTTGERVRHFTDLNGTADLTLFRLGKPNQKIKVNLADLGITTPQGRAQLDTRLTYSSGLAQLHHLHLKLAGQTVVSLKGRVCRPLTELTCTLTGKIGPLEGSRISGFWPRWPGLWDLSGTFSLSSTSAGGTLHVQGKIGQAEYVLKGNLNARRQPAVFDLDLDLKGLSTAQLKEIKDLKAQPIQGLSPVNAHLRLEGTGLPWNPASMKTRLELEPFRYRDIKVEKMRLELSGNARNQDLQASVAGNFGAVDLGAKGRLLPLAEAGQGLAGDLTVQTGDFQPAMVGVARLAGSSLTTRFTGKFRLPPSLSLAQLYLAGDLQANGRLNHQPLKDLTASFALEGRKLTLSQADLQLAGLAASFKGTLTESGMDVTFAASLAGSRTLPLPPGAAFAALSAEGAVRGPWKAPQVNLAAQAQKVSFKGVTLESANLSGALAGWPPQSGTLQILGSQLHTPAGTFTRLQLTGSGAGGRWQFQAAATSPQEPKFEVAGTADLAVRPLTLDVTRLSWHSRTLTVKNKTPFQVHLLPGWEISPATFQMDGGIVTVAGRARDQELSGHLEVRDLNAGLLAPLGLPASGKLNGRLTLAGNPRAPIIDGQIALSAGKLKTIPIQALTTTLNYQTEQAQVSGYLEIGPLHSRLVWKGSVPVKISLLPFAWTLGRDGLDLRVHSERVNLSLLTSISKEVQTAEGPLDLVVETRGNPYQPQISGYVRWSAGAVQLRQAGTPYRLAPGEIRLQGDKIVIPGLIIQSDGTIRLSGEIVLAGNPQARAQAQADNFRLLDRGGNELWTNGFIDLQGPLSALVAKGRLLVPKAQFRPTFFRLGMDPDVILVPQKPKPKAMAGPAPALYRNLRVDVTIDSPGNAWLIDPMGKVEMTAHLTARKDPGQKLALGGQIRALRGTLDIQDRTFTVKRASLLLPGVPGKPMIVDGKAVHEMDDITLVVTVNGSLTNPQIHLESQPPLPPADVLSYLVFGAPAATLTKEQYLAMGAQSLGGLGGVTPKKIDEILGATFPFLSGLKVRSGMVAGRPTVGVGKEIVKNVSVFVGRNLNEERGVYERQVGIEYKVNKHWSVESQIGGRNSGADVFFNYDF